MADHGKGGKFLAKAQKQLFRTKAKVLQNLGKADKTTDSTFDDYVTNFAKLQGSVAKLQKELKNYIMCAKGMAVASKSFCDVLLEMYEPGWTRETDFKDSVNNMELMWNDYLLRLESQVNDPIATYLSHFPPIKARVAKRGRKLVDFDSCRHNLDAIQHAKKKDESKAVKARDELSDTRRIYEDLNKDLLVDLPKLNNSHGHFYASTFQNFFSAENIFHENMGKINSSLNEVVDKLAKDNSAHVYVASAVRPVSKTDSLGSRSSRSEPSISNGSDRLVGGGEIDRPSHPVETERSIHSELDRKSRPITTPNVYEEDDASLNEEDEIDTETPVEVTQPNPVTGTRLGQDYENISVKTKNESESPEAAERVKSRASGDATNTEENTTTTTTQPEKKEPVTNGTETKTDKPYPELDDSTEKGDEDKEDDGEESEDDRHLYQVPTSNEPVATPPPGVLFQVVATHPYTSEDSDELTFEAGEVIFVMEHDDPDEQDDGWLMGIRQSDGHRGVFPENFTKRM